MDEIMSAVQNMGLIPSHLHQVKYKKREVRIKVVHAIAFFLTWFYKWAKSNVDKDPHSLALKFPLIHIRSKTYNSPEGSKAE